MPDVAVCPEDQVFRAVLVGDAPLDVELDVARHFVSCDKCAKRARTALANEPTRKAVQRRGEDRPLWQFWTDANRLSAKEATVEKHEALDVTQHFSKEGRQATRQEPPLALSSNDVAATHQIATSIYSFLLPPESKNEIGRLGGYSVVKLLGAGGMGMVFQAEDPHLKRKIALKVMRPEAAAVANAKSRFLREARTMASLEHDYIVAVFQVGEDRGVPFLAMPFLQGMPLDAVLRKNPTIPLTIALRMGFQIANGLAAAHAKGLIHRDIKPANIWIETQNNNRVKLLDFGLARGDEEDVQLTQSGSVLGTPAYMAPEQAAGGAIDARADLFSLGVVLYELTTGKRPFSGANTMAILTSLAVHNPPAPCEVASTVPEKVSAFIMRLLEKDPARRVGSAQEAAKELAALIKAKAATDAEAKIAPSQTDTAVNDEKFPTVRAVPRHQELAPPRKIASRGNARSWFWPALAAGGLGAAALLLTVVTILFRTPYGTLEVQIDDPNVEARFKNGALILADEKGATRYTLRPAAELADKNEKIKAGEYKLRVEGADGLTVETENFSLRDGKREIVKVILRPNPVENSPPSPEAPPKTDAVAAAWTGWPAEGPRPAIAPFDTTQAKAYQQSWADYFKVPVEYTNSIGMKFILIPPGEYIRGAMQEQIVELLERPKTPLNDQWRTNIKNMGPAHRVVLTQPFYLGATEVTQQQFENVMGANPAHFSATGRGAPLLKGEPSNNLPIETITWDDALQFASKLGEREQIEACYEKVNGVDSRVRNGGYRLPTEAEWEFACRAGTTSRFFCGDDYNISKDGWTRSNSANRTREVGRLNANAFGLHDVIGNVWEWTEDGWTQQPYEAFRSKIAVDPQPDFGNELKINRGGAFDAPTDHSASAVRDLRSRNARHPNMGMRIVLAVKAVQKKLASAQSAVRPAESSTADLGTSPWKGWPTDDPKPAVAPFTAAQAKTYQDAWAKHLDLPIEWTNSIGMTFVLIPPGEYTRGASPQEIESLLNHAAYKPNDHWRDNIRSSGPQHRVVLTQPFYVSKTEVTQQQYKTIFGFHPSQFVANGVEGDSIRGESTKDFPVDSVAWHDAANFATVLSRAELLTPCYAAVNGINVRVQNEGYRLLTEAEWEFAARAGTATRFFSGDSIDVGRFGWTVASGRRTHPVGSLKPNAFGLHDVIGNVWEWVEDSWELDDYEKYTSAPAIDPAPAFTHSGKLNRGGAIDGPAEHAGSAVRERRHEWSRHANMGIRLGMSVAAVRKKIASPTPPIALAEVDLVKSVPGDWKQWPADAPQPAIAPFSTEQARQHQKAWAEHLKIPMEFVNSIGMKFTLIPPGEYLRGNPIDETNALLQSNPPPDPHWRDCIISSGMQHHTVISQPFYLGVYEVTQEQYAAVIGKNPSHFSKTGQGKNTIPSEATAKLPVETVTWIEAAEFTNKLSQREKLEACYQWSAEKTERSVSSGYRIPSEAEWEWASRAGTLTPYYSGDANSLPSHGWIVENSEGRTHAVGSFPANSFGLHDMIGNVFEWTEDDWAFAEYSKFSSGPAVDPRSILISDLRTGRGGAFNSTFVVCGSAVRGKRPANTSSQDVGFRLLLPIEGVRERLSSGK